MGQHTVFKSKGKKSTEIKNLKMPTHRLVCKSPFTNARTVYVPLLSKLRE